MVLNLENPAEPNLENQIKRTKIQIMKKFTLSLLLLGLLNYPIFAQNRNDVYYQYNTWSAFVNKVFEGDATVKDLKKRGNIGLGSFNLLDGELVMLNNVVYRVREDGTVSVAQNSDTIIYVNAAFFKPEKVVDTGSTSLDFDDLGSFIDNQLPSRNYFYAFTVEGEFETIKCGGLRKQTPPFLEGLDILIPNRPVFQGQKIKGTMVGFYCPDMIGDINVSGYHFHFISDDKTLAGHVMEFTSNSPLVIKIDKLHRYEFQLPQTEGFGKVQLEKEFQYKNY
jgi:acetolactate decarboxylase